MDLRRYQSPCSLRIAHAREAIFGASSCKSCENFRLKTLRARLACFDKDIQSALLRRAAVNDDAHVLHEAEAWVSDVELEALESEQACYSLSHYLSSGCPILRWSFFTTIYALVQRHATSSPLDWRMFYSPRRLILRISGPWPTLSRPTARKRGPLRPIPSLWMC